MKSNDMNRSEKYFSKPKVSAAVVTYNKKESILKLLTFLETQNIPTFITDNGSIDGTREAIQNRFLNISMLESSEYLGRTGGFNCAILAALSTGSDYIILLDDDVMPEFDCIDKLSLFLDTHKDYVFAAPAVFIKPKQNILQETGGCVDFSKRISAEAWNPSQTGPHLPEYTDIDYASACCLMVRADAILKLGVMDWNYITFNDDVDWCFRLRNAFGKGACVTTAKAYHDSQWSKSFNSLRLYCLEQNNLYLKAKFRRGLSDINSLTSILIRLYNIWLYSKVIGDNELSNTFFHVLCDAWHKRYGRWKGSIQFGISRKKLDKTYFIENRINRILIDSSSEEYDPQIFEAITACRKDLTVDILCDADRVENFRKKKLFSNVYGRSDGKIGTLATFFRIKRQRYDLVVTDTSMRERRITCMAGKHSAFFNDKRLYEASNRPFIAILSRGVTPAVSILLAWVTFTKFLNTQTSSIPFPDAKPLLEKIGIYPSGGQPWNRICNVPFAPSPHFSSESSNCSPKIQIKHILGRVKNLFISCFPGPGIEKKTKFEKFYNPPLSPPFLGPGEKNRGYDEWCRARDAHTPFKYNTRYQEDDPMFSILVPVCDPPPDWLQECIGSVKSQNFGQWELILSDDGSKMKHVLPILEKAESSDPRIRFIENKECNGISSATNRAAEKARGEYLVFLDHDDILDAYALTAFAQAIKENKKNGPVDILYADEDCFDHDRTRLFPSLKPEYSPDLLLATNYIHHPVAIRRDLFIRLKGLRSMYDGSQDHDLLLRAEEICNQIVHIPDVLYHMRKHPGSLSADPKAKPEAHKRDRLLIAETMKRRGISGTVFPAPEGYPGHSVVKRRMPDNISVSVLIIPDGSSDINEASGYWKDCHCLTGQYDTPVAKQVNELVQKAEGDILIIASSEIRPMDGWKEAIVPHILRDDIGLVTGKISYHDKKLFSCGLTLAAASVSGRWHHRWPSSDAGFGGWLAVDHEVSAVPWQFMGIRRSLFLENGLFDTGFRFKGFEIDLALRLSSQLKLRHLAIPCARVTFVKGYPKDTFDKWDANDLTLLWTRWGLNLSKGDPYLNPNFSLLNEDVRMIDKKENDLRLRGCFTAYDAYTAHLLYERFH